VSIDERIRAYIETEYFRDRERFAPVVDYAGKGLVDQSFIAREKDNYHKEWPIRNYALVPGTLQIRTAKLPNEYIATFSYEFSVRNGAKHEEGRIRTQLQLREEDGAYVITGINLRMSP
jgi:hypothetical protein